MKLLPILLFSLFFSIKIYAASCCGGGIAKPSLILGDDKAQITTSLSRSFVHADAYDNGLWKKRQEDETSETFRIDASHIFMDRWQVGASLPIVRRSRANQSSSGLGDVSALLAYEYLPNWNYHPYRPKGVAYMQMNIPTGRSVHESNHIYALDSRGRGFWSLGLGTILTKTFSRFDIFVDVEVNKAFEKSFSNQGVKTRLKPGWATSLGAGLGYSKNQWRFGSSATWYYEEAISIRQPTKSQGHFKRYASLSLSSSYLFHPLWSASFIYSDQSLLGSPVNTSLDRSLLVMFQRKWLR